MESLFNLDSSLAADAARRFEDMPLTLHDQVVALYEEYRREVFRYLLILGLDPDAAQDLSQEVFLRLRTGLASRTHCA